jgi:phage-related minor tail protein
LGTELKAERADGMLKEKMKVEDQVLEKQKQVVDDITSVHRITKENSVFSRTASLYTAAFLILIRRTTFQFESRRVMAGKSV